MSIFDYPTKPDPAGKPSFQTNLAQAANFGANAGSFIQNAFSNPGGWLKPQTLSQATPQTSPIATAPGNNYVLPSPLAGTTPIGSSMSIPGVRTANAQTVSAAPGSPQAAALQQESDMQKYFPDLVANASKITPQSYNINPGPTINSSSANATMTTQDALNAARNARTSIFNGSAPAGVVPSDNLYGDIVNGIFNASQYTPQEQSALSQFNDTQSRIIQTQLAARRQIKQLQEDGAITKEQGAGFLSEAARRSDAQLADLAAQQSGNTLSLQTLGMLRQNQLGAYQNIAGLIKPQEVSPGSTLFNPLTGVNYQGTGAAPATIMQTAMSLWQQAQTSGTATYNQDGTPDLQPFLAQAQQYYGGGGIGTYGQQGGSQQQSGGMSGQSGQLPPQLATYLQASGGQIINEDKVPANQRDTMKMLAAQNGVPYLTGGDLDKYQSILVTQENLKNMEQVSNQILSSGLGGRTIGALWNNISGALQLNPKVASFKAWRDTAVNTIQALAGGQGSGFRLNQAEINLAAGNLPTINDNLETAQAKMGIVNSMLQRWQSQILTGNPTSANSTNQVVQTKAGAINTNW